MRYLAIGLALIASVGQIVPLVTMAFLVPAAAYLDRHRLLRPAAFLLFLVICACVIVAYPFWVLAIISSSYLMTVNGVRGVIEQKGIRLHGRRIPRQDLLPWERIRSIRWEPTPPLGAHYLLGLDDGSELRVDFLPFESPVEACEQVQRRTTSNDAAS